MQSAHMYPDPETAIRRSLPDVPVGYFAPQILQQTACRFLSGFGGEVTYAVKANPHEAVLSNLLTSGITAFDVASPDEIRAVRTLSSEARLHYNNPVRSGAEIVSGVSAGVTSWSVDDGSELDKLENVPRSEVAVRFALDVPGAAYDFGDKFGAQPDEAMQLLLRVVDMGFTPALCFHPGTQCTEASAWETYIKAAARIAGRAGVRIARLNVGGGFAVDRGQGRPDLEYVFARINEALRAFDVRPALLCEPGRAMVADAFAVAVRIKSRRADRIYLNDGIYGGLSELRDLKHTGHVHVVSPVPRQAPRRTFAAFGPTCDSLDRLPGGLALPDDIAAGDHLIFDGMGAYSLCLSTGFNGYGLRRIETVARMTGHGISNRYGLLRDVTCSGGQRDGQVRKKPTGQAG